MKSRSLILFVVVFSQLHTSSQAALKEYFENESKAFLKKNNGSGLVVYAVKKMTDSEELFEKTLCIGQARRSRNIHLTESTLFRIGELSKIFTTLILLKSVHEGKIELQKNIVNYLPKNFPFPSYNSIYPSVAELGCELSALPLLPTIPMKMESASEVEIKNYFKKFKLPRAPGKRYEPSLLGFSVLAKALTHVWNKSYEGLLQETLCKLLELNDTFITLPFHKISKCAIGHHGLCEVLDSAYDRDASFFKPSRGMFSSIEDMKKVLKFFLKEEKIEHVAMLKGMYKQEYVFPDNPLKKASLGWRISPLSSVNHLQVYYQHSHYEGFSHFFGFIPEVKTGVILLSNSSYSVEELGFKYLRALME